MAYLTFAKKKMSCAQYPVSLSGSVDTIPSAVYRSSLHVRPSRFFVHRLHVVDILHLLFPSEWGWGLATTCIQQAEARVRVEEATETRKREQEEGEQACSEGQAGPKHRRTSEGNFGEV